MDDSRSHAEAYEHIVQKHDHNKLKNSIIIPSADYDLHPLDSLESNTQRIKDSKRKLKNINEIASGNTTGIDNCHSNNLLSYPSVITKNPNTDNLISSTNHTTISNNNNIIDNINKNTIPNDNKIMNTEINKNLIDPTISNNSSLQLSNHHQIDKQSFEYILRSGLAGGLAGISAKSLIAPLDRVKILFQTNNPHYKQYVGSFKGMFKAINSIYSNDGILGLYQGHSATLLRIFPYAAIKFVCYEQIRTILIPNDDYETAGRRLLAGSLAGVTSVYFTYPLDLIRVRLAFETSHHSIHHGPGKLFHILKLIYNEKPDIHFSTGGYPVPSNALFTRFLYSSKIGDYFPWILSLSNFYRGFVPTILGMIPYAGVSFYSHDMLHDFFRNKWLAPYTVLKDKSKSATRSDSSFDHRPPLTTWAQLLAGGGAGMLAQASAYPFEVIRRRMQVGAVTNKSGEFYGLAYTAKQIFKERGFKGFYVGLGIGFLKVVPMFACSFYVYERCKEWLLI